MLKKIQVQCCSSSRFYSLGLAMLFEPATGRRESSNSKKRASVSSQRTKVSATIITQKTTLPQIETGTQRDLVYTVKYVRSILSSIKSIQPT